MIRQHSFSRWSKYEKCPRQAKYAIVDKLDEGPKHPAAQRGIDIHKDAENWLLEEKRPRRLPTSLRYFPGMFEELHAQRPIVEQQWAYTRTWEPSSWFAKSTWVRIIVDAFVNLGESARVIDFKTGKMRREHWDQMDLFSLGAFMRHPQLESVEVELWYLDLGKVEEAEFTPTDSMRKRWERRFERIEADREFEPRPSPLCKWCPFSGEHKGGPCDAG